MLGLDVRKEEVDRDCDPGLALLVALSGTGYAAVVLPKNSVGTVQLRNGAVTSLKVKDGALVLTDFAASERSKLQGAQGPAGAKGDTGEKGQKGDKGEKGDRGEKGEDEVGAVHPSTLSQATVDRKRRGPARGCPVRKVHSPP